MRLVTILFEKKEVLSVENDNAKVITITKQILHDEKDKIIEVMTMLTKFNYIRMFGCLFKKIVQNENLVSRLTKILFTILII